MWLDLTATADSYTRCAHTDPVVSREAALQPGDCYLSGADPEIDTASPLHAADEWLARLPPVFLQVGADEVLVDDSTAFTARLAANGVRSVLRVWPGVTHSWQSSVRHRMR